MNNLRLELSQKLKINTNLITSLEIMALNEVELSAFLQKESEENVFVDYDNFLENKAFLDYISKNNNNNYTTTNKSEEISYDISQKDDFTQYLLNQLGQMKLGDIEKKISTFLVYMLDDNGYLKEDYKNIKNTIKITDKQLEKSVKIIQSLEPSGICARNIKECLILQTNDSMLINIIDKYIDDILSKKFEKIAKKEGLSENDIEEIIKKIKSLNPKPALSYREQETIYVYPDIFVKVVGDDIKIQVEGHNNDISINEHYIQMLKNDIDSETKQYLKKKLTRIMLIKESIRKRRQTIIKIANYILMYQKNYIIYNEPLKDMSVKSIAADLNISQSTVSRAIKNKYVQLPKKLLKLKSFLSHPVKQNDEYISKDMVMNKIIEIVNNENKKKPLSDDKITDILNEFGIYIKRRTVTKYRIELQIENTRNRKIN